MSDSVNQEWYENWHQKFYWCPVCDYPSDDKPQACWNCGYEFEDENEDDDKAFVLARLGGSLKQAVRRRLERGN